MPCGIGANHCRLRHIGWEKCGHGLTCRPRESASDVLLNELLLLFQCPPRCPPALLEGTSLLRYCARGVACRIPTWRLPAGGYAADLVTEGGEEVGIVRVEPGVSGDMPCFDGGGGVDWSGVAGGGVKRVRLNRKTPAHLVRHVILGRDSASATCLEETERSKSLVW